MLTIVPCIGARIATVPLGRSDSAAPRGAAAGAASDLPWSSTASGSADSRRTRRVRGASARNGRERSGDLAGDVEQLADVLVDEARVGGRVEELRVLQHGAEEGMFVAAPSMRNSPSAVDDRRAADARSALVVDVITLASSESKLGVVA